MSAERSAHDPPPRQSSTLQEYNATLEKKLVEYAELYQRLGVVISDGEAALREAEARAQALEGELEQARASMASLGEKLAGAEARLAEAARERESLSKELAEAHSRLNQLEEATLSDALDADGRMATMLHEQAELSTSLAETRARLQAAEAALREEKSDNETLHQKHKWMRYMLVVVGVVALGTGLFLGWGLTQLLTR